MDIKLRARLSAYSKVSTTCEECDADIVTNEQIDELFDPSIDYTSVTKTQIDELFIDEETQQEYDTVSFAKIDTLFN